MRAAIGSASLRTQFVAVVVAGAVLPLGALAWWLTSSGVRAGERLLESQLEQSAQQVVAAINARWEYRRGDLLLFADNDVSARAVSRGAATPDERAYLERLGTGVQHGIVAAELVDAAGRAVWSMDTLRARAAVSTPSTANRLASGPTFPVEYAIRAEHGSTVGTFRARVLLSSVIPSDSARPVVPGARLGVRLSASKNVLTAMHPEVQFPSGERLAIAGVPWLATVRAIEDPGIEIVLAAPLAPYTDASREAGRFGLIALSLVTVAVLGLTGWLTTRITRPLHHLADAAEAVSRGEMDRRVNEAGPAEVRRAGRAFNVMAESLRTTLDELSRQSALAAVGGFASSLSHDVRNALTSIKVDIERTLHRPMSEAQGSAVLHRAANNVARLESLVSGALRLARRGHVQLVDLDIREPVRGAVDVVAGAFSAIPATLSLDMPDEPARVSGDAGALEQLFANILFNAAQALSPDGRVSVRVARNNGVVVVEVEDTGRGMSESELAQLQQPFYSSRPNGTGLGLPIARQIATAHGAELHLASVAGKGTTATLRFRAAEFRNG